MVTPAGDATKGGAPVDIASYPGITCSGWRATSVRRTVWEGLYGFWTSSEELAP